MNQIMALPLGGKGTRNLRREECDPAMTRPWMGQERATTTEAALIRAPRPSHHEFDLAAGQLPPRFDLAHVSRGRPLIEKRPRRLTGLAPGLGEDFADIAIAPISVPAGAMRAAQTSRSL
jgi:hypothetical protein